MDCDEIIENWLIEINHEYRDVTNLELSEGINFVESLRKLIRISKEDIIHDLLEYGFENRVNVCCSYMEVRAEFYRMIKRLNKRHLSTFAKGKRNIMAIHTH